MKVLIIGGSGFLGSYVADELSKIYSLPIEKVSEITTKNALQLFNL